MKRRTFIGAVGAAAAASSLPAPAIAQGVRELKLVGGPITAKLAQPITDASGGRLKVRVLGETDELLRSESAFVATSEGFIDMFVGPLSRRWPGRTAAFDFFAHLPFGLTANETRAWIHSGGGQELWDELCAGFNVKPFVANIDGEHMGGWYKKEINSVEEFNGLRMRISGLGGKVFERLGAIVVSFPGSEIASAFRSGALDAAELASPYQDLRRGFHKWAKYYYYPAFHEPGVITTLAINKEVWESLTAEDRVIIELASAAAHRNRAADIHAFSVRDLQVLVRDHGVQLRRFNDNILRALGKISGEVVAEIGASDPFTRRVYESYMKYREASLAWTDISARAYLNARALDFPYGI